MQEQPPSWCRWRAGTSSVLLIAPHGGAQASDAPVRGRRVNDLHTAEIAEELADALDASLIANPVVDRNTLDLNRLSQVTADASWFLDLIEHLVAHILTHHARAELLFVHGWNVVQAKCDLGIGRRLAGEADAAHHPEVLTVSPAYVRTRLGALRAACAGVGIEAPYGERYPGRHPNNLLQVFRRGGTDALPPRLRAWRDSGRIEAVQLELAIPLRWPGPRRRQFAAAMHSAFGLTTSPLARQPAGLVAEPLPASAALRFYDPAAQVGLAAQVEPRGQAVRSSLLLFLAGQRVALFTGEDSARTGAIGGDVSFAAQGSGCRLTFEGALLVTNDGRLFVDTERALAASALITARADLLFTPHRPDYGRVHGRLIVDGRALTVDTHGFAHGIVWRPDVTHGWRSSLILHAAFAADHALRLHHRVPGGLLLDEHGNPGRVCQSGALAVDFAADSFTPRRIALSNGSGGLAAVPIADLAAAVPLGGARTARLSIGVARITCNGAHGYGFFEYARLVVPRGETGGNS